MRVFPPRLASGLGRFPWGTAAFLAAFYLYVWLAIDPGLLYFWLTPAFPAFLTGTGFLKAHLLHPGGPLEYVTAFVSQLYYWPWLGALVITLVAGLLCRSTGLLLVSMHGAPFRELRFVPALLILWAYNGYAHLLGLGLAALAATAAACLYAGLPLANGWLRAAAFLVLGALLYYVAGGAFLLYAFLCGAFELATRRRALLGLLCALVGAGVPYAGSLIFGLRLRDAYARCLPWHPGIDPGATVPGLVLYAFLALAPAALAMAWRLAPRAATPQEGKGPPQAGASAGRRGLWSLAAGWAPSVVVVGVFFGMWLSLDKGLKAWLEVQRCARQQRWDALLKHARGIPPRIYNFPVLYEVNRALYHTGRLGDGMFLWPQHPSGLLPSPIQIDEYLSSSPWTLMSLSDAYFELGCVNESEHMAHEVYENVAGRPWPIERIARTRIVKGQVEAGRIFLSVLARDAVFGGEGRGLLRRLDADPTLADDPPIRQARSAMPREDYTGELIPEIVLEHLLAANPRNKMAFEYLMAHYLLTRNLDGIAKNINRLDQFDYTRIPRYYEEALLLRSGLQGAPPNVKGRTISAEAVRCFREFSQVRGLGGRDARAAAAAVPAQYRDTYFFYYFFGPGGASQ